MIRFDPSLLVERLVVVRNDTSVYDEPFHAGVNVIRGENSSGKSTVLNLLFYGLGGELSQWSEVALLCNRVIVQVRFNGIVATLSRDISNSSGMPMEVFGGEYLDSVKAPKSEWMRFPYRRTSNQESFSQAIFRLLGLPEVLNDVSGKITVHQVLRLLYADQLTPVDDIFRFERFDQANLRDTVGRLLCGAYSNDLYQNEILCKEKIGEFDDVSAGLRSLIKLVGSMTTEWIQSERAILKEKITANQSEIEAAERSLYTSEVADELTLEAQADAYSDVQRLQAQVVSGQDARDMISLSIADSDAFIAGLKSKIESLRDFSLIAACVGEVRFATCPACFSALENGAPEVEHACHLCKTPFDSERSRVRIAGLINETAVQVRQSEALQAARRGRLAELVRRNADLETQWRQAAQRLSALQRLPSTVAQQLLRRLHSEAGYFEREAEDLEAKLKTAQLVGEMSDRKAALNAEIGRLRSRIADLKASHEKSLSQAYTKVADEIRSLLRADLRRQDAFERAEAVEFTFADNKIIVDGQTYFSASSRAILKSSFFLGFLAAAAKSPIFRHPRFCVIDVLENMGVEATRSHNFQIQILSVSRSLPSQHQIIYGTAMIAPDLDDPEFTVGKFSTRDEPTLAIQI